MSSGANRRQSQWDPVSRCSTELLGGRLYTSSSHHRVMIQCYGYSKWGDVEQCIRTTVEYSRVLLPTHTMLFYKSLCFSGINVLKIISYDKIIKIK